MSNKWFHQQEENDGEVNVRIGGIWFHSKESRLSVWCFKPTTTQENIMR